MYRQPRRRTCADHSSWQDPALEEGPETQSEAETGRLVRQKTGEAENTDQLQHPFVLNCVLERKHLRVPSHPRSNVYPEGRLLGTK